MACTACWVLCHQYTNEDRRAEELPYHLERIEEYGKLSHCLMHFPVFERLSDLVLVYMLG